MFEKIVELIKKYDRIIIHRHTNPDGDAIGSQVGLKHIILANFEGKEVFCVGDKTKRYAFMEESEPDILPDDAFQGALAIILDTSARELISDDRYKTAAETARIDHHIFIDKIADHEVVDTSYESCCGLVTELAIEAGLTLDGTAARSLYTGLLTDSGRFRYDSTDSGTFRRAAFLMKNKIDTNSIFAELYSDELDSVKLRAEFVLKIEVTENRVGYIYTTLEEFKATGKDAFAISRGMVGTMSDIKGIDIWVNFTETENGVLCEIRSSKYNINPIAVKYGGGGHAKASGATLKNRSQAMALLNDLESLTKGEI
ncbi:MAG: bifunctional oligoribonuclease/PAP phosphatase NrnA [Clostridia bacterium]|nr:bifunctional oligoribonuclease/PAP phosphatase NrnA [Clostridia bacterium]